MHRFSYRGRDLYCEDVKVADIVQRFGTPLYIYSANTILDHFFKLKEAFRDFEPLICFSVKSNFNLAILRLLIRQGSGADVVSGGELYKALKAGCPPKKIVYAGVGKREDEIEYGLKRGILFFNVESLPELKKINEIAKNLGKVQDVCLRLNPDVDPQTHKFITTGKKETKFGLSYKEIKDIFRSKDKFENVRIKGIHIHIGSQIIKVEPFLKAIKCALSLRQDFDYEYLNIGGGLGIIYKDEKALTAEKYAREIKKLLKGKGLKLILEPGRFIVGNAGILVTRVLYNKKGVKKNFIIVDAGMNLLIRPALYSAYHEIKPIRLKNREKIKADVVGPICETTDFFAQDRSMPEVREGEYLALFGAGAYGFTMASNYNAQPRCAEVLVKDDSFYLIRRAESYKDLVKYDVVPDFLK
jgi:diaminopimelate decarboxylase